jgi:saccharopine dehydrogenase-like NADP-dependent oxidoreductase
MNVLVLGCGLQGKGAIYDLCNSKDVEKVICADINIDALKGFEQHLDMNKVQVEKLDVSDFKSLVNLMKKADVAIDLLPVKFIDQIAYAGIEAGVHVVNSMYGHQMSEEDIDQKAKAAGVTILPEVGLDPGIDLVLCGYGVSQLDEVTELHSWTGGFPTKEAIDNEFKYKVTWTWYGVLLSYARDAKIMEDGVIKVIKAEDEFRDENLVKFDFPGIGALEAFPNGDAVTFCEHLGISDTIKSTSRRAMRWEGHGELWTKLKDIGFLSNEPVEGLDGVSPIEFLDKFLGPKLQYKRDEKDMVAMRNIIKGKKDGKEQTIIYDMVDTRDLETGLYAMNRTVGFTASIAAQMIANGQIKKKGLLTSVNDVPYVEFIDALKARDIEIKETIIND